MKENFLPTKYEKTLNEKMFLRKQGSKSVEEYFSEFLDLIIRNHAHETNDQKAARYNVGLRTIFNWKCKIHWCEASRKPISWPSNWRKACDVVHTRALHFVFFSLLVVILFFNVGHLFFQFI